MKKLFDCADRYLQACTWKDLALLKFCLAAMGVLIGLQIPKKHRITASLVAGLVFLATYIPLMSKFFRVTVSGQESKDM